MSSKLDDAIADSHYLLAFCARVKLEVRDQAQQDKLDKNIAVLADIEKKAERGSTHLSTDDVSGFWNAFIFVSNIAYPATIEGIRYYFRYYYKQSKNGTRSSRLFLFRSFGWYRRFALVVLFSVLYFSVLQFVGSQALDRYNKDVTYWAVLSTLSRGVKQGKPIYRIQVDTATNSAALISDDVPSVPVIRIASDRIERLRLAIPGLLSPGKPRPGGTPAGQDEITLPFSCDPDDLGKPSKAQASDQSGTKCQVSPIQFFLAGEFVSTYAGLRQERKVLVWALQPFGLLHRVSYGLIRRVSCWLHLCNKLEVHATIAPEVDPIPDNRLEQIRLFLQFMKLGNPIPLNVPPPLESSLTLGLRADLTVSFLTFYLLPLLAGLLGAFVHVLREINTRLDSFTLTDSALARYRARLVLGMVAGPAITWFFDKSGTLQQVEVGSNTPTALVAHLPLIALAFLAGFAIEILFSVLDRIILTFREFAAGPTPERQGRRQISGI